MRKSKQNTFYLFLGLTRSDLARNKVQAMFLNILKFYTIFFFEFFSTGRVGIEIETKFFFPAFSARPNPVWLEIKLE